MQIKIMYIINKQQGQGIMNLDQLLEFCAYYHINKHLATLPLALAPLDHQEIGNKQDRSSNRQKKKKVETIASTKVQKTIKSKVQMPSKRQNVNNKSHLKADDQQNNLDLNFFINHVSGSSHTQHANHPSDNRWNQANNRNLQDRNSNNLNKYSTFGKIDSANHDFLIHQKTNNRYDETYINLSSRNPRYNPFQTHHQPRQQYPMFSHQSNNFQNYQNYQNNAYSYPFQQNLQATNAFKMNSGLQTHSKVTQRNPFQILSLYSPIKKQNEYSPSHSAIGFNINNSAISDRSLSKSRKKHKRKNSERPFYDASNSKLRQNKEKEMENKLINQSAISNSFISAEISKINSYPTKGGNSEGRRETAASNSRNMKEYGHKREASDLDDEMQEIISNLANEQRAVPIAINLRTSH